MAKKGFNKKLLFIPLAVLLVGGFFFFNNSSNEPQILPIDTENKISISLNDNTGWHVSCNDDRPDALFLGYDMESTIDNIDIRCNVRTVNLDTNEILSGFLDFRYESGESLTEFLTTSDTLPTDNSYGIRILSCQDYEYNGKRIEIDVDVTNKNVLDNPRERICN